MLPHKAAITCRTAPSFIRVGHFDLFARRVAKIDNYYDDGIVAKKAIESIIFTYHETRISISIIQIY